MSIEVGGRGQFDIFHAGELVASKKERGPDRALFGCNEGFPEEEAVIEVIGRRLALHGD